MSLVGSADAATESNSPGTDGNGTGVPTSTVIQNITAAANAIAADVAGTFRATQYPQSGYNLPATGNVGPQFGTIGGFSVFTLLLIGLGVYLVFKIAD